MNKKQLIYEAVRNGAATYEEAIQQADCSIYYAFEVGMKDPELTLMMANNKRKKKLMLCKDVIAKVDEARARLPKWFNVEQETGILKSKYFRCKKFLEETGQSC